MPLCVGGGDLMLVLDPIEFKHGARLDLTPQPWLPS
jgi:hypothetical protein